MHSGIDQASGLRLDALLFNGLPADLESAEGALVILTSNLAVEHGLMNGTHGIVRRIVYTRGKSPLAEDFRDRMPDVIVVDCPQYVGPAFFAQPASALGSLSCLELFCRQRPHSQENTVSSDTGMGIHTLEST